jgi:methionyl-tRNA formyltransferase
MERFLAECDKIQGLQIVACVVYPPLFKPSLFEELSTRYAVYGLKDFIKLLLHAAFERLKAKLWKIGVRADGLWPGLSACLEKRGIEECDASGWKEVDLLKVLSDDCDVMVSIACPRILSRVVLDRPKRLSLNYHTGALPKYRGRQPLYWALYNGEKSVGITVHEMVADLDGGPIVVQEKVDISGISALHHCYMKTLPLGAKALARALEKVLLGDEERIRNDITKEKPHRFPTVDEGRCFRAKGLSLYP